MLKRSLALVFMFAAVGMAGCSNKAPVASPAGLSQQVEQSVEIPSDFKMIIGRGGGVGGRVNGYSFDAEGAVSQWEGKYPEENVQRSGIVSGGHMQGLWTHVKEVDFFSLRLQDLSGSGHFMMVTANGVSHRVSWKTVLGQQPDSSKWQQLYDRCIDMASTSFSLKG